VPISPLNAMCHSLRCESKDEILGYSLGQPRCSLKAFALSAALLLTPTLFAQNANPDDSKVRSQPCVIVKRHVHKFGENMSRLHPHRPFDYVEPHPHMHRPEGFGPSCLSMSAIMRQLAACLSPQARKVKF
jgi:hypothetical protein